jgi:hypothetical protein
MSTRRAFLALLTRSAAAGSVATNPVAAAAATGPILPADFIAQRLALGDQLYAHTYRGKLIGGFIEYFGEYRRGAFDVRSDLWRRAYLSGADFNSRVGAELFARGMIEAGAA